MTREELIDKARAILRLRHLDRYGFDYVDEKWLNRLSDDALERIIWPSVVELKDFP